jgi:hypothetical protein
MNWNQYAMPVQAREDIIRKNNPARGVRENCDQPMFVFKPLIGFREPSPLSPWQVKLSMGLLPPLCIVSLVMTDILIFHLLRDMSLSPAKMAAGYMGILAFNGACILDAKRFRDQAIPWLQALKEKESHAQT